VYLPCDFSDEYVGCLRCRPGGDVLEVVPGMSRNAGWNIVPGNPSDYVFGAVDFQPDVSAPIRMARVEFVRRIRESIADTESQLTTTDGSEG
jgi:hypothetical protein